MSLFSAAERFARIDRSEVILDAARCLHSQDQYSDCTACLYLCPVDAIAAGKPPALKADLCQSCLACLPACPVGAFHADDAVAALLNCAARLESNSIELVCGPHPHPEIGASPESTGLRVHGCLAGLGTGALVALAALGLERILLRTDACEACKWGSLGERIDLQAGRANDFLAVWEKAGAIRCIREIEQPVERPLWDAQNPPLSRRDLFRMMARQSQVSLARLMEAGQAGSKRQPGRDRLRLLAAVSHLPAHTSAAAMGLGDLGFATLTISESCTACGVCGRACPTDALRFEKNEAETSFTLSFSARDCIGCDLCVHVCAPEAITLEPAPAFEQVFGGKEPIVITAGELTRCERCKTLMAARPGARLCPLCEYRRTHPFGSRLPPGMSKRQSPGPSKETRS